METEVMASLISDEISLPDLQIIAFLLSPDMFVCLFVFSVHVQNEHSGLSLSVSLTHMHTHIK